jgi:hypothetical protein
MRVALLSRRSPDFSHLACTFSRDDRSLHLLGDFSDSRRIWYSISLRSYLQYFYFDVNSELQTTCLISKIESETHWTMYLVCRLKQVSLMGWLDGCFIRFHGIFRLEIHQPCTQSSSLFSNSHWSFPEHKIPFQERKITARISSCFERYGNWASDRGVGFSVSVLATVVQPGVWLQNYTLNAREKSLHIV